MRTPDVSSALKFLLELCRISNLPTVWTNITAAWVIAGGRFAWDVRLLWLILGGSLMYSAGMILNDVFDVAWDRQNRPERPIPSGRISLWAAWGLGVGGLLGGYAIMVFAGGAGWGVTALLLGAIVLYDAYHKPWPGSVLVMGACRTLLYLAAGSAAAAGESPGNWRWVAIAGGVLGLYIVALTLSARAEGRGSIRPFIRWGLTGMLMLPFVSACFFMLRPAALGNPWAWVPVLAFALWTWNALATLRQGGASIGGAVGLLLAGIPLVDALNVAPLDAKFSVLFCLLPPFLRLWQRWVAAT